MSLENCEIYLYMSIETLNKGHQYPLTYLNHQNLMYVYKFM